MVQVGVFSVPILTCQMLISLFCMQKKKVNIFHCGVEFWIMVIDLNMKRLVVIKLNFLN